MARAVRAACTRSRSTSPTTGFSEGAHARRVAQHLRDRARGAHRRAGHGPARRRGGPPRSASRSPTPRRSRRTCSRGDARARDRRALGRRRRRGVRRLPALPARGRADRLGPLPRSRARCGAARAGARRSAAAGSAAAAAGGRAPVARPLRGDDVATSRRRSSSALHGPSSSRRPAGRGRVGRLCSRCPAYEGVDRYLRVSTRRRTCPATSSSRSTACRWRTRSRSARRFSTTASTSSRRALPGDAQAPRAATTKWLLKELARRRGAAGRPRPPHASRASASRSAQWFRGELRGWVEDILRDPRRARARLLRHAGVVSACSTSTSPGARGPRHTALEPGDARALAPSWIDG